MESDDEMFNVESFKAGILAALKMGEIKIALPIQKEKTSSMTQIATDLVETSSNHLITFESPIEFVYDDDRPNGKFSINDAQRGMLLLLSSTYSLAWKSLDKGSLCVLLGVERMPLLDVAHIVMLSGEHERLPLRPFWLDVDPERRVLSENEIQAILDIPSQLSKEEALERAIVILDKMPKEWTGRWCESSECACLGGANCSGGLARANIDKDVWREALAIMEARELNKDAESPKPRRRPHI